MRLAPFFGIRGTACARWLNRILVTAELLFCALIVYVQITDPILDKKWFLPLLIVIWYLGCSVLNAVLHKVNAVVLALYYGTDDPDEIVQIIRHKEERKGAKARKFREAGLIVPKDIEL